MKTLLTRKDLAIRWGLNIKTIEKYECDGIITRNPNIPTPRYSLSEIENIEGFEYNPMSPIERRKLVKENEILKEKVSILKSQLIKLTLIGVESNNILSNLQD